MDYLKFVEHHRATNADITIGCLPVDYERASDFGLMKVNDEGEIVVRFLTCRLFSLPFGVSSGRAANVGSAQQRSVVVRGGCSACCATIFWKRNDGCTGCLPCAYQATGDVVHVCCTGLL